MDQGQPQPDYVLGLDLGQAADYTALAVAERTYHPDPGGKGPPQAHYGVRHLKRWPLGTPYTTIVPDVAGLVGREPLKGCLLGVDQTGVGIAVVDMVRQARVGAWLHPILITAGHEVANEAGVWHVPKKELVSMLQVLLQTRRLKVAALPERQILLREFLAFRVKITTVGNETFEAWREQDHDDLVLAVALAAWLGERSKPFAGGAAFDSPRRGLEERYAGPRAAERRRLFGR
jgi:hypothetical protein